MTPTTELAAKPVPITVVIADDEPDLRLLVRRKLERSKRFSVVAEACDGHRAIYEVVRHQPDILLLDLRMPSLDGRSALPEVVRLAPRTMVVILSVLPSSDEEGAALRNGAFAYLEKTRLDAGFAERLEALLAEFHRALEGEDVLAPVYRKDGFAS